MRRQTATSGINPAGSSRALRLDPLSLPVRFDAHDIRADGGVRHIELHRERVVLRRAVQRHADGDQRPRQRFSRRRAARHRRCARCWCWRIAIRHCDSAAASAPIARRSRRPGRCGARSSRCRNCRKTRRASPRRGAAATTRSGRGVRNSWCGGARRRAPAIHHGEREIIAAHAQSQCARCIARRLIDASTMHCASRCTQTLAAASPRRPAIPRTAAAPRRGWI